MIEILFVLGLLSLGIYQYISSREKEETATSTTTPGSEALASKAKAWILTKANANWKAVARAVALLVGCHILVRYFWPELWRNLASNFVFWLDHVVLLLAFLFFREVNKRGKKEFVPGTSWVLYILLLGNIWTIWVWGESYYIQARAKTKATQQATLDALPRSFVVEAPVGGEWSARVPTLHGESWQTEGPIYVRVDSGQVTEDGPGELHPIFRTNWVQFRSRTKEAVKVTVFR